MLSPLTASNLTSIPLRRAVFAAGFQTKQRLIYIKATLAQNGITDLAALGKLQVGGGRSITPTPGILIPPTNASDARNSLYGEELLLSRVSLTQIFRLNGFPSDIPAQKSFLRSYKLKPQSFSTPVLPFAATRQIPLAYWVADEIEIPNDTIVVFTSICEELYIIANKVKLGTNVQFTWQEPSDHSRSRERLLPPSQPRQNKRPDSEDEVIHGTDQIDGKPGEPGVEGVDAPRLEIWTLNFEGRPYVQLKGQDGQLGQDGQDGSKGQNGANGISGKVAQTPIGGFWCERKAGSGGDGASGGRGGNAGDGGNGGNAGRFSLFAPKLILESIAGNGFYCDLTGGNGGNGGRGGNGAEGGEGGSIGQTDRSTIPLTGNDFAVCGPKQGAKNGRDGRRGGDGQNGRKGEDGSSSDAAIRLVPIDENEFRQQLSKPAIQQIQKDQVIAGDQLTIQGLNFTNTDKVLFDEKEGTPVGGITSNTIITVVVPNNIDGGNTRVSIKQTDGTLSNVYTIVVKPNINAIVQTGQSNRFKPGQDIIIHGSGFSRDSTVFANGLQLREFVFVDNT